jgi:uncharacterized protein YjlB
MNKSHAVTATVQILMFERNEWVPNNPRLPVLVYPNAIAVQGSDPAALFEKIFSANGWPPQWRYGVYSYHHYHTEGHEVLGIASGQARLMLGGPDGHVLEVSSGDVLLLPAGTGGHLESTNLKPKYCVQCSASFCLIAGKQCASHRRSNWYSLSEQGHGG